ncbi:MAG: galactokinase, partial [Clostridiales bacterium]|nr:galactokinase [Clostridiales bacterium]
MKINKQFQSNKMNQLFHELYLSSAEDTPARYSIIHDHFMQIYGAGDYRIFSAPGRVEVSGNHTDHNNGLVIATAVDCDTVCFARKREDMVINLSSFGYAPITVNLNNLDICKEEYNTTIALVRGVAAGLRKNNHKICGFDAVVHSTVLSGSGLSSSAAFEVLLAKTISTLCNEDIDPIECAKIAQFAENHYFGKPSGLMDQLASSVGGLIAIDFLDPTTPSVQKLSLDLQQYGYHLIITDTGGSHADLTPHYATIPEEMHMVAQYYNKETLRDVDAKIFMQDLHQLRDELPHRALLRALHYF